MHHNVKAVHKWQLNVFRLGHMIIIMTLFTDVTVITVLGAGDKRQRYACSLNYFNENTHLNV